jgi:hypothetical protein
VRTRDFGHLDPEKASKVTHDWNVLAAGLKKLDTGIL